MLYASRDGVVDCGTVLDVKYHREHCTPIGRDQSPERLLRSSGRDHRAPRANGRVGEGLPEPARSTSDEPYTRHSGTHLTEPTMKLAARLIKAGVCLPSERPINDSRSL